MNVLGLDGLAMDRKLPRFTIEMEQDTVLEGAGGLKALQKLGSGFRSFFHHSFTGAARLRSRARRQAVKAVQRRGGQPQSGAGRHLQYPHAGMCGSRVSIEVHRGEEHPQLSLASLISAYASLADNGPASGIGGGRRTMKPAPAERVLCALDDGSYSLSVESFINQMPRGRFRHGCCHLGDDEHVELRLGRFRTGGQEYL